jgi:uncharacterized RDD family membrane protein YckC
MVSGEAVTLDLQRAGLGSRLVAAALDGLVQLAALLGVIVLDSRFGGGDDAVLTAVAIVEVVLIFGGYPIVFEWLSRGRTLGKLAMGLRVVRDDGGPIGFRQALVRGLAGLLIEKPGLIFPLGTAVGAGVLAFSESNKRIGDFLAGTFVLSERAGARRSLDPVGLEVRYDLQPWASSLDLTRLDDGLAFGVRQFVQRASAMSPSARHALGEEFRWRVLAAVAPPPPWPLPTPVLLITVLAERRRRAELSITAPPNPSHASAREAPGWHSESSSATVAWEQRPAPRPDETLTPARPVPQHDGPFAPPN